MTQRTMKVRNITPHTRNSRHPQEREFPPGEPIEVDYEFGLYLTKQREFERVKERTDQPKKAAVRRKVK